MRQKRRGRGKEVKEEPGTSWGREFLVFGEIKVGKAPGKKEGFIK